MYPVKLLPEALRFAARLNPLTYGVDALKHVISPLVHGPMSPDFSIVTDLAVIIVLSVIFVFAGAKAFERRG